MADHPGQWQWLSWYLSTWLVQEWWTNGKGSSSPLVPYNDLRWSLFVFLILEPAATVVAVAAVPQIHCSLYFPMIARVFQGPSPARFTIQPQVDAVWHRCALPLGWTHGTGWSVEGLRTASPCRIQLPVCTCLNIHVCARDPLKLLGIVSLSILHRSA